MKKLCVLVLSVFIGFSSQAQIINFSSQQFKNRLLATSTSNFAKNLSGDYFQIDSNNNGEIEQSEAAQVSWLYARQCGANNLSGIEFFINIQTLHCDENYLSTLDLSACTQLSNLYCDDNFLTSLNVSTCSGLLGLWCDGNSLTTLELNNHPVLRYLHASDNMLTNVNTTILPNLESLDLGNNLVSYIDVMNCPKLTNLSTSNNPNLTTLLVKNGKTNIPSVYNCPNLIYVCCDDSELVAFQNSLNTWGLTNCALNTYCSFVPGGLYYTFQGNNTLDINNNGCESTDPIFPFLRYSISSTNLNVVYFSDDSGTSSISVPLGSYVFTPYLENSTYFNLSSTAVPVTFPANPSPFINNVCISPNGNHQDLEVVLIPTSPARPGFSATYTLIYKNKGNQTTSGYVYLNYSANQNVMTLNSATPNVSTNNNGTLTWDYVNLQPFETRTILLNMTLNTPTQDPALNAGDDLGLAAIIFPIVDDEYYVDNHSQLKQIVVNSYDPNDKTCLEGTTVTPDMIGQYVHYVIRFENTGTFPAENIVVKDMIDLAKFDINTLIPLHSSHNFVTRIIGNKVEFIFEGINLPFDDATNDGYIAFKIKTKSTLVLGDTFTNSASIYFDYNFPIITNTTTTTVAALNVQDFDFNNYFTLYPNPAKEVLNVQTKGEIGVKSVTIYNMLGQMVLAYTNSESLSALDVSQLKTGTYFIKLATDKGATFQKFIKE
jgi:hypothetical protein